MPPPTNTLKPTSPAAFLTRCRPTSCQPVAARSSVAPVMAILNLRGRKANSGCSVVHWRDDFGVGAADRPLHPRPLPASASVVVLRMQLPLVWMPCRLTRGQQIHHVGGFGQRNPVELHVGARGEVGAVRGQKGGAQLALAVHRSLEDFGFGRVILARHLGQHADLAGCSPRRKEWPHAAWARSAAHTSRFAGAGAKVIFGELASFPSAAAGHGTGQHVAARRWRRILCIGTWRSRHRGRLGIGGMLFRYWLRTVSKRLIKTNDCFVSQILFFDI